MDNGIAGAGAFCFFCVASLQQQSVEKLRTSRDVLFLEKGRSVLKAIRVSLLCSVWCPELGWCANARRTSNKLRQDKNCLSKFVDNYRKLSDGLVTASSYCGLTSSGIEQCSCCTSPNGPVGQTRPRTHIGASLFHRRKRRTGEVAKKPSCDR